MTVSWLKRPRAASVSVRPKLVRKTYELTPQERYELESLRPVPSVAFDFWRKVAARCDVDPDTILAHRSGERSKFTALPFGHGKWWCWPTPLECIHKSNEAA